MAALAAALLGAGCAQVGPPRPPSANLPAAPASFAVRRTGDALAIGWHSSPRTSDGAPQRGLVRPELCLWPTRNPRVGVPAGTPCPRVVAIGLSAPPGSHGVRRVPLVRLQLRLPGAAPAAPATPYLRLALGFANARGQLGLWSPFSLVSLIAAPAPPNRLAAALTPAGVRLRWALPAPPPAGLRVFRREIAPEPGEFAPLVDLPPEAGTYLDRGIVWGQTYAYEVRAVAGTGAGEVLSPPAGVTILVRNIFPPPAPQGLDAVLAPGPPPAAVDLSWLPVTAPRFAGYNAYRRANIGARWIRLNAALLLTPVFRDPGVAPGTYAYAVTAVDNAGNESVRSAPVTLRVPAQ